MATTSVASTAVRAAKQALRKEIRSVLSQLDATTIKEECSSPLQYFREPSANAIADSGSCN